MPRDELAPYVYTHNQPEAIRHAFRVASGLDSMVIGEPQILGQMKDAVRAAEEAGTLGHPRCTSCSSAPSRSPRKCARTTAIGANIVSHGRRRRCIWPSASSRSIAEQRILFIGAGEMIELCAAHFCAPEAEAGHHRQPHRSSAAGRWPSSYGASAIRLDDLAERLAAARHRRFLHRRPLPIIGLGMVERAIKARRHRPMFMVDLAVPRDIEAEVGRLDDVFLYTVDDLAQVVESGLESRQAAVVEAEDIIANRVKDFLGWLESRETGAGHPLAARLGRTHAPPRDGARAEAAGQGREPGKGARPPVAPPDQQVPARPDANAQFSRWQRAQPVAARRCPAFPSPFRRVNNGSGAGPVGASPIAAGRFWLAATIRFRPSRLACSSASSAASINALAGDITGHGRDAATEAGAQGAAAVGVRQVAKNLHGYGRAASSPGPYRRRRGRR